MSAATLKERADTLARTYLDQGVTFDFAGEERPFPLDIVPRVIAADEWQVIEPASRSGSRRSRRSSPTSTAAGRDPRAVTTASSRGG